MFNLEQNVHDTHKMIAQKARKVTIERQNAVDATSKALWWALGVLLLTTVHHVYGAFVYNTPWRNHVAIVSTLTAAVILASHYVLRRRTHSVAAGRIAFWVFAAVTLAIPVVIIGLFEGGYNHVVKDALYFTGASPGLMRQLFPPPTYEMPNDALFEITGVLQLVPAVITGWYLIAAVGAHLRSSQYAIS
ncbi:MAG TPA: hypothetical protein VFU37_22165 [Pyrinomonadaceae bacterium]|nr:hypothetical protein [Pyrinomonadaceae bacterium]